MDKTTINHPFGNGLYHLFISIYGDLGDALLLFYPHYGDFHKWRYPNSWMVYSISFYIMENPSWLSFPISGNLRIPHSWWLMNDL